MNDLSFLEGPEESEEILRLRLIAEAKERCGVRPLTEEEAQAILGKQALVLQKPLIPEATAQQQKLLDGAWRRLTDKQKAFLYTLRDCNFSERAAVDALEGTTLRVKRTEVRRHWNDDPDFALAKKVMQNAVYDVVIDQQRTILRQAEIVEEAMRPEPVLYHGLPTGLYRLDTDKATRANESLAKMTGLMKNAEAPRVRVRIVNLAGPDDENAIEGLALEVAVDGGTPDFLE